MRKKFKPIKIKSRPQFNNPGASPGYIQLSPEALKPQITVYSYDKMGYNELKPENYAEVRRILNTPEKTFWVDVRGLGDIDLLRSFQDDFDISSLVLEDIIHTYQRPKLEEYTAYAFAISRMLTLDKELKLENEQVSFILTSKVLFTFQENYTDCLDPVRKRLKEGKGTIRSGGTSYLMYALMDVILDNYFTLINRFGEDLESLEDCLYEHPDKTIPIKAQQIKRGFIVIRRAAWPERDKLNDMLRSTSELITDETKVFLHDAYDHSMQIIDLVESYKEISNSLIDTYLSFASNRMNQVMKVLTIISAIFIPLTFIAGVYGMNFAHQDPDTGKILEKNMPELYSEHGYVYTLLAMLLIGILQLLLFWRKGWLK
ncbi:magnesium/cobalt transporter CorA [Rubrolithibacter danxiaensis]|uniref:magnesium/cobalt transporter CorA n=1 Tax=Rubrolithibacter danxiaensis TaxID=3390805 RepID=UPI003BF8F03A